MNWKELFTDPETINYINKLEAVANTLDKKGSIGSAFDKLLQVMPVKFVVIGGIARTKYAPARVTNDIDILLFSEQIYLELKKELISVPGFKPIKGRAHAWLCDGIEIEFCTPEWLFLPFSFVEYIFETAIPLENNGYIISKEALVVTKLFRNSETDRKDVLDILKGNPDIRVQEDFLNPKMHAIFNQIKKEIKTDS